MDVGEENGVQLFAIFFFFGILIKLILLQIFGNFYLRNYLAFKLLCRKEMAPSDFKLLNKLYCILMLSL